VISSSLEKIATNTWVELMSRVFVVIPSKYKCFYNEEISLVKTIYSNIIGEVFVRKPNPRHYVPRDKIEYLKEEDLDKIIIMDRLRPSQLVNLTRETGKEIIDRVLLILQIFEHHAGSIEAKLQIELARLKHQLPLVKEAIRYAKLGELHGFLGAGRYGYERYYTMLRMKEARIRRKLEEVRKTRMVRRMRRIKMGYPHIAIIGYTCAGKTTLFNKLTANSKPVGPEPFTTLSPKSSRIELDGVSAIVTDTVGFIRDLPHEIIEAFYATLEEVSYADIILHVIDSSKPLNYIYKNLAEARRILSHIGVQGKPSILVLNKIDLLDGYRDVLEQVKGVKEDNEVVIPVSAEKNVNIEQLKKVLADMLKGRSLGTNIRT